MTEALASLDELEGSNLKQSVRAEVRNLRGIILMREHDYEAAQKTLEQALELAPSLSNAKFNLGEIAFLKRDWIEARRRFERILVEDSRDLESGCQTARILQGFPNLSLGRKRWRRRELDEELGADQRSGLLCARSHRSRAWLRR